jgi:hypothetical protein
MVGIPVHQTLFYATNVCSVHDPVTGVVLHPGEIGKVWGGWSYEWQMPTVIPPTHAPEGEPLPDGDDYTDDDYTAVPAPSSPSDGTLNGRAGPFFDDPRNEDLKRWYEHFWLNDPDPFAQYGTVPDCRGLTHSQCLDLLEEEGFLGTITTTELDWHTADVDVEPEHVVDTDPDGGSEVIVDTEVEIKVNPDEEGMPVIVPAPLPGETSQQYADRLEELGLEPDTIVLPDTSLDPQKGPNEIVGTNPQPGQRVQQGTPITIRLNPPTAPPVGPVPGSCDPHNIRGFNLDPLAVPVGDVFPFGIFGWMADAMSSWGASPVAPSWSIPLGPNLDLPLDLAVMQPVIDYLRPVLLIVSAFGLVWMLAAAALKINAPQGDD